MHDRLREPWFTGWRMGVLIGCIMTSAVLCINIVLLLFGAISNGGYRDGVVDLVFGDDRTVARWNTGLHLLINVFGSCLLAASNYTIQVISSPTREEIDKVHAQGSWLAVGLLSPRNWKRIARKRVLLAVALGLSSVPLHVM